MKTSTWPCRKSPSTESTWIATLVLALAGCQVSHEGEPQAGVGPSPATAQVAVVEAAPRPAATPFARLLAAETAKPAVATVSVRDCSVPPQGAVLEVRTAVMSDFGTQPLKLTVTGTGPTEQVKAEIEGYRMSFPGASAAKEALVVKTCAALKSAPAADGQAPAVTALPPELQAVREWTEAAAPDCTRMAASEGGFTCHLPQAQADGAKAELTGIQTTMIRRWSRQPYLLARRLAVGIDLASALEGPDAPHRLDVFCNVARASLPIELPATLASHRWQSAVCGGALDPAHRLTAASFGLAKTVAEIDFMRQLFERTSRLGFLTLRIPSSQQPTKEVLISLTPLNDVADNLARETTKLWLADDTPATPDDMPHSCWHPVYAEDATLLKLARQLAMAGEASRVRCEDGEAPSTKTFAPERYFAESVTSETQFVLTNGRAKTLRLPIGRYSYTIRPLPDDPDEWDDASQVKPKATGEIDWDAKRPRPVINTW